MLRLIAVAASLGAAAAAAPPLSDVFVGGEAGYACYRIPSLLRTLSGGYLAFAEARKFSCGDHGWVDLVVKRADAITGPWSAVEVVHSESSRTANVTIGNPAPIATGNGTIVLPFCRNNTVWGTTSSADGGQSWSTPVYHGVPSSSWSWIATGPPGGLALASGRLVVPIDFYGPGVSPSSATLYSDDGGGSWHLSNAVVGGNECQAAPLPWVNATTLILSARSAAGSHRLTSLSTDDGASWSQPWAGVTETQCEGSILALAAHPGGPLLVQSSAFDTATRANLTLHTSSDNGHTWVPAVNVYPGAAAYSALAGLGSAAPGGVAVLFERDNYASIALAIVESI